MPWLVGIDEAGYGPNLGPFVMAVVACRVPAEPFSCNLWEMLRSAVRRPRERKDGRLLIEDSKLVYSTPRGFRALERGVLATICANLIEGANAPALTLERLLSVLAPEALPELREEPWYTGTTAVPHELKPGECTLPIQLFRQACTSVGVCWARAHSFMVCPPRFNALLERWGSKAIVLAVGLAELIRHLLEHELDGDEPVHITIDKQGGRNNYTSLVQQAVPEGAVTPLEEGAKCSCYEVIGGRRPIRLIFEPRADAGHFTVALASMLAKYLRELCMHEFNQFWRQHVPDLKPTAGYPTDARRFLEDIRAAATRLGIAEAALWRRK